MAVINRSSSLISNRDATPKVFTDNLVSGGEFKESEGYVTATNGDSANSVYRLCTVPSRARVSSLLLQCAALGAGAKVHLGVYWPDYVPFPVAPFGDHPAPADAGAAISAQLFGSAIDVSAAISPPVDEINQSGNNPINKQEMSLWQAAGLSADPGIDLDICATVNVAIAATGLLQVKARYQS